MASDNMSYILRKNVLMILMIFLFVISLMRVVDVQSEASPATSQISLPYKAGDWFEYKVEYRVGNNSCWSRIKFEINEIDPNYKAIVVKSKILAVEGDEECKRQLGLSPDHSTTSTLYLDNDPQSAQLFIDPEYTGTYNCSQNGVQCVVNYNMGVLRELTIEYDLYGYKVWIRASLVASSVSPHSMVLVWVIISVVGGLVAIIVLLIVVLKKRERIIEPTFTLI